MSSRTWFGIDAPVGLLGLLVDGFSNYRKGREKYLLDYYHLSVLPDQRRELSCIRDPFFLLAGMP